MKKKKHLLNGRVIGYLKGYLFLLPSFAGLLTFVLIPILMGFVISFTNYDGYKKLDFVGLNNYIHMFQDDYVLTSLKNNVIYTAVTVPATMIISLLLALALNMGMKGSTFFRTMIFFPTISSMVAVGIVWSLLFNPVQGPVNQLLMAVGIDSPPRWLASTTWALWAIMIVAVWKQAGYYMVIFLSGLQAIPKQLYESAQIDGANSVVRFFKITLPMLSPTTFMVLILSIIGSFQVFDLVSIMTDGGPGRATNVLVYRIYQEGFEYSKMGYASAIAYFLFLIIFVITLIQFRGQQKWVTYME